MSNQLKLSRVLFIFLVLYILLGLGCSPAPVFKETSTLSPLIKNYRHFDKLGSLGERWFYETGIFVEKGEIVSLLPAADNAPGAAFLSIGNASSSYAYHTKANDSGYLSLGYYEMVRRYSVAGSVDILVWKKEDWSQILAVLAKLKQEEPGNRHIVNAIAEAKQRQEIFLAETKTNKEVDDLKKELETVRQKPISKIDQSGSPISKDSKPLSEKSAEEKHSREKTAQLEEKLAELVKKQAELEEMKERFNEERKKADSLVQELEERQKEQEQLRARLRLGPKALPVILVASPNDRSKVESNMVDLSGVAEAELGLERIEISVNNKPVRERSGGKADKEGDHDRRMEFRERIPLAMGENKIKIRAVDTHGLSTEKTLTILFEESRKNMWAVVIGINNYRKAPQLKYAVNDARAFHDYLMKKTRIPHDNVKLLLNSEASLSNLRSTLGTQLKNKAGKEDMVIVYFAGHGATERDVRSPDGDGLEKYLLPFDADLKDLYASALPMREISYILQRISSERLVFIIDSCYSGASGGRTVKTDGARANISDGFLDRVVSGRGMVIMTASGANEVSVEKDDLGHGVFTYFLLEGLEGKADIDRDGLITVDEAYDYVSKNVPKATGQEQHPVRKGTVEGQLILGILN